MDRCRICLKSKKNQRSIFDSDGETTFNNMITSVANIPINKNDQLPNKICFDCLRQLREAYNFKLFIKHSHDLLNERNLLKRIYFSDLNDIKVQTGILDDKRNVLNSITLIDLIQTKNNCISYNDILIRKLCHDVEKDFDALDQRNEDSGAEDFHSDTDIVNESEKPLKLEKHKKEILKHEKVEIEYKICKKPIKPKVLKNVVLLQNDPDVVKKRSHKIRQDICPYCGKITKSLKAHALVHTGEKKYKCEICSKGFLSSGGLTYHKKKHTASKDFKCDQCIAAFVTKEALRNHMIKHAPERKFVCNTCEKGFKRKFALKRHAAIHNFGKKKIKCESCEMSFHTNAALNHHMRVHTRERPYNCEICKQPYSYKHDFNRHCFKKHGVFLKRRPVYVMNEEVLAQERIIMKDLLLRIQGIIKDDKPLNPFEGPQAHLAFEQAVKALESNQIAVDL